MANQGNARFLYSVCSGYNYYTVEDRSINVLGAERRIIRHFKTGEEYCYIDIAENRNYIDHWIKMIRHNVECSHISWPVDIIEHDEKYALVFPYEYVPRKLRPLKELFTGKVIGDSITWGKAHFELMSDFLNAMIALDEAGYAYYGLSDDHCIYFNDKNKIFIGFTKYITWSDHAFVVDVHGIDHQYADPFFYTEDSKGRMDLLSMYHTVSVFLFRLLIGKLPFDGHIMAAIPDRGEYEWINYYHKNSIYFIFGDEADDKCANLLGEMADEEDYINRWQALSPEMRDYFSRVFQHKNVMRECTPFYVTPQQWKQILTPWFEQYKED